MLVAVLAAGLAAGLVAVPAAGLVAVPDAGSGGVPARAPAALVATLRGASIPPDSTNVRIAMTENDGNDLIVTSPGGVSAPGVADSPAVYFHQSGGAWDVYAGSSCAGPWGAGPVLTGQATPTATPVSASQPLGMCIAPPPGSTPGATANVTVDGTLTALYNSAGSARAVNTLPLETYVADTVPGESPSYWATLGGPGPQGHDWGFQELEAQAVAVRSYVLANPGGYGGYADTCDLTCQTYRGTKYVTPASIAAATDTAGEVMYMPGGSIATTEYSSSTGGYTTGGPFDVVPDTGDAVCVPTACNSRHDWTVTVPFSSIEAVWPQYGPTPSVTVTRRNGYGAWTGRVTTVTLAGNGMSGTVTGAQFASALTLLSDWFNPVSETATAIKLTGHGWGHGIGMGQWGALGYAIGTDGGHGTWTYQQILGHYYAPATLGTLPGPPSTVGASGGIGGYWLAAADGGIFSFGNARFYGSMGGKPLNAPIVGVGAGPGDGGYWLAASDGGIFSFGTARFYGSMGGKALNAPVVGMAPTATGQGYWLVAADGGIFSFGTARFYGSMGGKPLNAPVVGMAPTATGQGYWLVAADGGIFSFGAARFYGSTGSLRLAAPVVGMARTPTGQGYWLVASDGGVFTFGAAAFEGSAAGTPAGRGSVTLLPTLTGHGYDVVTGIGAVVPFGDAPQLGDLTTAVPGYRGGVVGAVPTAS
ncbi:MAG: SpoIID/LytB domain-containing protein [Acidimicrobiales bacterium]